eukprot:m.963668 g.963668  ORF g.963668 m.963668 type:complete len:731 (+) comp23897_c0_seq6:130-2322(+)
MYVLLRCALLTYALCAVSNGLKTSAAVEHIIFFMIDDYGFADASYKAELYNGTNPPPTPNIDTLAKAGVRLESYYVNKLCSPTRTAFLSGRYAYTIGMDNGVIVDGQNIDLPLNIKTIADHLKGAGWRTSAYGKWDAGMTAWGSTPTCRGFDNFHGFYSAASDYYTHMVGGGFDYHNDTAVDDSVKNTYTTHAVTAAVQQWIRLQVSQHGAGMKSFAYVAHEAVHGPLEVPVSYIDDECRRRIPDDFPSRLIYCGMVRAVDESVGNITQTYKELGIWNNTLVILSADNGGNVGDGGNNYPLRGNKATTWEGGVRGLGFVYGAGLAAAVQGTVNHEIFHVTDWLPTLVVGAAGVALGEEGRPCPTCTRAVAPLDGVNQWPMLHRGVLPSARTEVLLDLDATACWAQAASCVVPGTSALRMGRWKLIHGHPAVWQKPNESAATCTPRSGAAKNAAQPTAVPVITAATSTPWCPNGWVPPPRVPGAYEFPQPPPDAGADCVVGKPCTLPDNSPLLVGTTMLFDVVADPFEHNDVARSNPTVVAQLLARLREFNASHCAGAPCLPVVSDGPRGTPTRGNWLPWRGDPNPAVCDTNVSSSPTPETGLHSSLQINKFSSLAPPSLPVVGWCWDGHWSSGGVSAMTVQILVDDTLIVQQRANVSRAGLPAKTGAPNTEHGFAYTLTGKAATALAGAGLHRLNVKVFTTEGSTGPDAASVDVTHSPVCYRSGVLQEHC